MTAADRAAAILAELEAMGSAANVAGMARVGIGGSARNLGVSITALRARARELGRDHALALALWQHPVREARLLASIVDDPKAITRDQMDAWVREIDSWDVGDQCCSVWALADCWEEAARDWVGEAAEFVRRAGFVLIAWAAVKRKKDPDGRFLALLPVVEAGAGDGRNFVKKAVSWALRQVGKRSLGCREAALAVAVRLEGAGDAAARWVGRDARRELEQEWRVARMTAKAAGKAGRPAVPLRSIASPGQAPTGEGQT